MAYGGSTHPTFSALTEQFDGSSWTEVADMSAARAADQSTGSTISALAVGGRGAPATAATEEWTVAQNIKVLTD